MGALMRAKDWSATPLGPVEGWPQSLRTAVSILLNSRYPMFTFWGPQRIKIYNDAYRPIPGDKHPWALGRPATEVWPEIWDDIGPMVDRVMREGEATWSEDLRLFMHRRGFTEEVFFTFSYSPIRDESGGIGGMFCACTETTAKVLGERRLRVLRELAARAGEARSVEEAVRTSERVLREDPEDVPFAAIDLGDARGWTAGRHRAEDLRDRLGELPASPWGEPPTTVVIQPLAERGMGKPAGMLAVALSPRLPCDDAYRGFLELAAGEVAAAISNARAVEEERRRSEALAELDRAKTAFFSNVSHEFRTPLTLMLGPLESLLAQGAPGLPEAAARDLELVNRNALRLLRLVNTLLDFSRIEAGRMRADYEPTDLAALTAELASTFRAACERAGLTLAVDCPRLPEPVFVDRSMWEKVVLNLVSNAFKFTFDGGIAVSLFPTPAGPELTVQDTGTGIPREEMPRIFERFHRVENSRGRTHEGSGIGLALVQELVKLHGGSVAADSVPGEGTRFTIRLPWGSGHLPQDRVREAAAAASPATTAAPFIQEALRWLPDAGPADDAQEALPPEERAAKGDPALRPRVLVADDNADLRQYLARLLGDRYRVETAPDGEAALAAARAQPPDLVLTDAMMPRLDGFALIHALRSDSRTREVPVILLSARAGEESRIEGIEAGADDYLVKPFGARELLARVASHLQLARLRRESAEALRESEARLQEADRRKDEFLATLAHELRNPLAPVRNALGILRLKDAQDTDTRWAHDVIDRQVTHLTRLIDDLLDVSRISRNRLELRRAPIELADAVAAAVEAARPLIEKRRHALEVDLPAEPVRVMGDLVRLAQVFTNLLSNAAKYTDPGGHIRLSVRAAGGEAVVRIEDDGVGIAPEKLPHLFQLFYQVDSSLERSQGGLGIGLALVRLLAELHGGSVAARSDGAGRGSEFAVRLPLLAAAAEARPADAAAPAPSGMRILVVDDAVDSAASLAMLLRLEGNHVRTAHDGVEAFELAQAMRPDVVLLDIAMPRLNGYDACRRIRAQEWGQSMMLIAQSGWGQEDDKRRAADAGFDAHLVKPIDPAALHALLERLATRRASAGRAA